MSAGRLPDRTGPDDRTGPHDPTASGDRTGPHDPTGPGDRTGPHDLTASGDRTGPGQRTGPGDRSYRTSIAGAEVIEEPSNDATVRPLAAAREGGSSVSVTWVSLNGRHRRLASRRSVRIYYLLSGVLTFMLDGAEPAELAAGELLVVPKGCPYHYEGSGTCLVLNTPAFEAGDDEYADQADVVPPPPGS